VSDTWAKKLGKFWLAKVRFCPWCGVEAVENDPYWEQHNSTEFRRRGDTKDFTCRACGQVFRIARSARKIMMDELFHEERRKRAPNDRAVLPTEGERKEGEL
jgi:hypothetical protein